MTSDANLDNTGRYAVYFAPEPCSELARFGAAWLGYDVAAGALGPQPEVAGIIAGRLREITAEPRQYGFHATLKPPFVLVGRTEAEALEAAVAALAASISAFAAPPLCLARISGFWALTMSEACPTMDRLAERCVKDLDAFRAPPSAAELKRRRRARLSPRQAALLACWGYPYVMEEFRFHMTLTSRLDAEEGAAVGDVLAPLVEPLCQAALRIDAISLFRQERREDRFRLLRRYKLTG